MLGYSVVFDPPGIISKWSEINFKPFGFLLAESSSSAHPDQVDITCFKNYGYNEQASLTLKLPYLDVRSPEMGTYWLPFPKD